VKIFFFFGFGCEGENCTRKSKLTESWTNITSVLIKIWTSNTDAPAFQQNYKEPILCLIKSIQILPIFTQSTKEVTSKRKTHQSNTIHRTEITLAITWESGKTKRKTIDSTRKKKEMKAQTELKREKQLGKRITEVETQLCT
jgi:hypothetical protein